MNNADRIDRPPVEDDLRAAAITRHRLERAGMVPIVPAPAVAAQLLPGENLLASHAADLIVVGARPRRGTLHLTSRRLVHLGAWVTSFDLRSIEEMGVAGRRLWATPAGGPPIAFELDAANEVLVQVGWAVRSAA